MCFPGRQQNLAKEAPKQSEEAETTDTDLWGSPSIMWPHSLFSALALGTFKLQP